MPMPLAPPGAGPAEFQHCVTSLGMTGVTGQLQHRWPKFVIWTTSIRLLRIAATAEYVNQH